MGSYAQITILSGSKHATQYRCVDDLAKIVAPSLEFKIENKETQGSSENADRLIGPNTLEKFAILQADYLYYLKAQDMRLNTEKTKNLKIVAPIGYEQIHLVTKANKGFKGLSDLKEKNVAIGSAEQGTYRTAMLIMERSKVNFVPKNTHFDESLKALNRDEIDAFFIVSSSPIEKMDLNPQAMVEKLALVPLLNFNDWADYYKPDIIQKADYKWLDQDTPTFSVPALLVVNESKLSAEERNNVLLLKSAIEAKLADLKANGHPTWKQVNLNDWDETDWPLFK
jgi:uncharacterized protein